MYYVYFLLSLKNKKVYVGRTTKTPTLREKEHNEGSNIWTRQNCPVKLVYYEQYHCEKDSIEREKFYKTGFGKKIKKIIVASVVFDSERSSDG